MLTLPTLLLIIFNCQKYWIVGLKYLSTYPSWCPVCLWISYGARSVDLLCPKEKDVHSSSWEYRYTHWAAQSSKRFEPLSVTILLWQSHLLNWSWCLQSDQVPLWNSYSILISIYVWEISSLRDRQQITFVTLNGFCPLRTPPPPTPCS